MPFPNTTTATLHLRLGYVAPGTMTAGSPTLSAALSFTAADVGNPIMVLGAGTGGAPLFSSVLAFGSSSSVTLADNAITSVAGLSAIVFRAHLTSADGPAYDNLRWSASAQTRDTFSFDYISQHSAASPSTTFAPAEGQPVLFSDDVLGEIFGGTIDQVVVTIIPGDKGIRSSCLGVTYDKLLYKRTIGAVKLFTNQTLGAIAAVLATAAADDGVTLSTITGPVIPNYQLASYALLGDALDQICQLASTGTDQYHWRTDTRRVIHIEKVGSTAAPWNLTYTDSSDRNALQLDPLPSVTYTRQNFANRAIVKVGTLTVDATNEEFLGDGATKTFATALALNAAPVISIAVGSPLSAVLQTVGVRGVDTGRQWYWALGSKLITQDAGGTAIATGDSLVVSYQGQDPNVVVFTNSASVTARKAIEGGSGLYEVVQDAGTPASLADAATLAQALATSEAVIPKTVTYGIYRGGLVIGQTQRIDLLGLAVSDDFIIDSVTLTLNGNLLHWGITATRGPLVLNWANMLNSGIQQSAGGSGGGPGSDVGAPGGGGAIGVTRFTPVRKWIDEEANGPYIIAPNNCETVPFDYDGYLFTAGIVPATGRFSVFKSTDHGRTWSALDDTNAPADTGGSLGTCIYDGAGPSPVGTGGYKLRCLILRKPLSSPLTHYSLYLRDFNLATETWGTAYGVGGPAAAAPCSLFIRPLTNTLLATFDVGAVTPATSVTRMKCAAFSLATNTWGSTIDLGVALITANGNTGGDVLANFSTGAKDDADTIHFFLVDSAYSYFWHQAITSANSLATAFFFKSGATDPYGYKINGNALILDGRPVIGIVAYDGTNYNYKMLVGASVVAADLAVSAGWALSATILSTGA